MIEPEVEIKGTKVYLDDMDIIQLLRELPDEVQFEDKPILRYLEETGGRDLMICFSSGDSVYTVTKWDVSNHDAAGLALMVSPITNTEGQIHFLKFCKEKGAFEGRVLDIMISKLTDVMIIGQLAEAFNPFFKS